MLTKQYVDLYQVGAVLGVRHPYMCFLKTNTMPLSVFSKMCDSDESAPLRKRVHGYEIEGVIEWLRHVIVTGKFTTDMEKELRTLARGAA